MLRLLFPVHTHFEQPPQEGDVREHSLHRKVMFANHLDDGARVEPESQSGNHRWNMRVVRFYCIYDYISRLVDETLDDLRRRLKVRKSAVNISLIHVGESDFRDSLEPHIIQTSI